ncbi:unnamed protein product [Anisakis simplex]|uniref:BTB domain-containing protein n=1 Tax=Anisakis simplex TaxID=6269 RepID=A0A0M3JXW5_ANISI|nr:unnamed protein product [Anisakis simplex]
MEDEGTESDERENGYPLVADLSQLRMHSRFLRSIDDVIDQQAFNQVICPQRRSENVVEEYASENRQSDERGTEETTQGGKCEGLAATLPSCSNTSSNNNNNGTHNNNNTAISSDKWSDSVRNACSSSGNRQQTTSPHRTEFNDIMSASVVDRLAAITSSWLYCFYLPPILTVNDEEVADVMVASAVNDHNTIDGESSSPPQLSNVARLCASTAPPAVSNGNEQSDAPSPQSTSDLQPTARLHRTLGQQHSSRSSRAIQRYPLHNAASLRRTANDTAQAIATSPTTSPALREGSESSTEITYGNATERVSLGWQASKSTLKERFSFMYCNELLADVYFTVGRDEQCQRIPAHKFVLATGSAVFDAMFNGGLADNRTDLSKGAMFVSEIELPDVEPNAFLALLKFLYSDELSIEPESVMTTLYTAKKYAIPAMEKACVDFLKRNLSADNAFMLLTQARLFDEPQLASLCLEIIDKNTTDALNADGFTEVDLETLCVVLKRDTLRVREAALFMAVLRWTVEQCHRKSLPVTAHNQRKLLGKALYLIRFPLMTIDEFAQCVAQSGILDDHELVSLFLYFTVNPKPAIAFIDIPRCCVFGKEVIVNRFQRVEGRWGYSGTPDRIKFTVDRKIYVIGFGLHGSIHGPYEYEVTIQILHCGTGKVLASNDTSFTCDGSSSTFRVLFKEPVEITPCVTYIASACLKVIIPPNREDPRKFERAGSAGDLGKPNFGYHRPMPENFLSAVPDRPLSWRPPKKYGPDSHYGTKGLRRIVHQSPTSGIITFQFTYAAGNNNGTSVEDGQIPEIIFCTKLN